MRGLTYQVACVEPMDLEAPGNLARVLEARSFRREVVMLVTDLSQSDLALNMVLNLRQLGVEHYILITTEAEDARLCHRLRVRTERTFLGRCAQGRRCCVSPLPPRNVLAVVRVNISVSYVGNDTVQYIKDLVSEPK